MSDLMTETMLEPGSWGELPQQIGTTPVEPAPAPLTGRELAERYGVEPHSPSEATALADEYGDDLERFEDEAEPTAEDQAAFEQQLEQLAQQRAADMVAAQVEQLIAATGIDPNEAWRLLTEQLIPQRDPVEERRAALRDDFNAAQAGNAEARNLIASHAQQAGVEVDDAFLNSVLEAAQQAYPAVAAMHGDSQELGEQVLAAVAADAIQARRGQQIAQAFVGPLTDSRSPTALYPGANPYAVEELAGLMLPTVRQEVGDAPLAARVAMLRAAHELHPHDPTHTSNSRRIAGHYGRVAREIEKSGLSEAAQKQQAFDARGKVTSRLELVAKYGAQAAPLRDARGRFINQYVTGRS